MVTRKIKFAIYHIGKITDRKKLVGYERITKGNWEWMCLELNPDKGERWTKGCFPSIGQDHIRVQYTGELDQDGKEVYEGDYISNINVTFEVFWDSTLDAFRCKRKDSQDKFLYELPISTKYWVSGNIYETK